MGSSGTKQELEPEKINNIIFETLKSLPEDEYTCPQCDLVPEIINIDYTNFEITLDCIKHNRQKLSIIDYFQKESQFIYTNKICDVDYRTQKDNKDEEFYYCPIEGCNLNLCGQCSKKHSHRKSLIEIKNRNIKCHHNMIFTKFCKTCKKHLCEREEQKHDKNHIINNFVEPSEEEIESLKNKKKYFEEKIRNYEYSIKLLNTILNTYEKYKNNYFHNLNIINISQNIDNDEVMSLRNKNNNFEKLLIDYINDKYNTELTGEEINVDLSGKKIGNEGLKMLTQINFINLESLNLSRNEISNLEPLQDFKLMKVKKIDLSYNNITDISPLEEAIKKMPRLVNLKLNNNLLQNVDVIKKGAFANIEKLSLDNNKITKKT